MPSKEEIAVVRKATVYDLQKILDSGEKDKTYTVEEIKALMDAYVTGRGGQPPRDKRSEGNGKKDDHKQRG